MLFLSCEHESGKGEGSADTSGGKHWAWDKGRLCFLWGLPGGSDGKESACNAGDLGSIPGLGRSWGGHGNPLQYSGLGNPHGQRSLASYSPWGCKELDMTEPWSMEWSRAKANSVLPRERTGYNKHSLPTTQEKTLHMVITRWSAPKSDWLYSLQPKLEKLYTVRKNKTRSWLWLRSWTPYCQIQT